MAKRKYTSKPAPFTRPWIWQKLRSFFSLALITLLIWVYADMKFNDTRTFTTRIRLTVPKASNLVILSSSDVEVRFELEGSRESLDAFQQKLKESITYELHDVSGGIAQLPTRDILDQASGIVESGLRLVSVQPGVINLRLDRLARRELPVELAYSDAQVAKLPTERMGVTAAQSQWDQILARQPDPVLKTVNRSLKAFETGKPVVVEFQIIPEIAGIPVQPDRKTLSVPLTIRQRTDKKVFTVPVMVQMPPEWLDASEHFELIRKDPLAWRAEITVTGAVADLDRLDPKSIDAYVVLLEDDKKPVESWLSRQVQIRFPPDLDVRLEGESPAVQFRLQQRPELPPPPSLAPGAAGG